MLTKFSARNFVFCALLAFLGFASSCKKSSVNVGEREQLTKDSIYLYAQQTYFWNVGMPSYQAFNPRQYSSNNAVLSAIKALPSTGGKDKYSFIDDGSVADQLGGFGGDYGFSANYDSSEALWVKYVYLTSPAGVQGLKRGYRITKINGSTDLSRGNLTFINNAIFGSNPSISLTVLKPDGSSLSVVVNRGGYNINPILFSKTYTVGAKKVGYIVYNSFTTNSTTLLDAAFAAFSNEGVSELVVDLRYNGGGSVQTSEDFTNLIAPPAQTGNVMYTTFYNQTMQNGNATILQNQKFYAKGTDGVTRLYSYFDISYKPTLSAGNQSLFAKRGNLNGLNRVYFIVTGSTASASELLINNLKPVMDVRLIGKKTYGKPVGFFAIHIDKSDLYIPQFQTKNAINFGDYFDGLTVDKDVSDDLTKDFGDPSEKLLAQALYYSANGTFTSSLKDNILSSTTPLSKSVEVSNNALDHDFKGMVESKRPNFK